MKWLHDSITFLREEKAYTALLLLFALAFVLVKTIEMPEDKPQGRSEVVQRFEKAEDRMKKKIEDAGSIEKYLEDHPQYRGTFQAVMGTASAAVAAGLILNGLWIFWPGFRQRGRVERPPLQAAWKLSAVTKTVLEFAALSFVLSGVLLLLMKTGDWARTGSARNFFVLMHTAVMDAAVLGLILYQLRAAGGHLRDIGWALPSGNPLKEVLYSLQTYLSLIPIFGLVMIALMIFTELTRIEPDPHALVDVFLEEDGSKGMTAFSIFLGVVIGPVFEELFFRGFCYGVFKQRWGKSVAMVLTSSFFAAIHGSFFAFWPVFILGMGLNILYEKRGTLFAPVFMHIFHNGIFISYFFVMKNIIAQEGGY